MDNARENSRSPVRDRGDRNGRDREGTYSTNTRRLNSIFIVEHGGTPAAENNLFIGNLSFEVCLCFYF
jgi:hypothetical protein